MLMDSSLSHELAMICQTAANVRYVLTTCQFNKVTSSLTGHQLAAWPKLLSSNDVHEN